MENHIIGREVEKKILKELRSSQQAELVALYGRRRVGKTFLIRSFFENEIVFELTGINKAPLKEQLENFSLTLSKDFKLPLPLMPPKSWLQAFHFLIRLMEENKTDEKKVIFIDEFPWLDTPKSSFLAAFDHFWNTWASKQRNLIVVICGSAASWMIQHVVRNKGGLHNRITKRIRLYPFNLYETEQFLKYQKVNLDRYLIIQLYMATGGIPQYLRDIKPGESATQAIGRLCFTKDGPLRDEFKYLYTALFEGGERHIEIVRTLANKPSGLNRKELVQQCNISSGGTLSKLLDELLESGFISEYLPFGNAGKDTLYKLSDEYSLFYLNFIEQSKAHGESAWIQKSNSPSWTAWCGLAFENIWLKHIPQIKKALGIAGIYTEQTAYRYVPKKGEEGTQIDLLLDRSDNCINIAEIKYSKTVFTIDGKYAQALQKKRQVFLEKTKTNKTVFITMLTTKGVTENDHYINTVQNQLDMDVLFSCD